MSSECGDFFLIGLGLGACVMTLWFGYYVDHLTNTFKQDMSMMRKVLHEMESKLRELEDQ